MDTKMSKMETKIDQLTKLINLMMNKDKPTVTSSDEVDRLSEVAQKAADGERTTEDDPEKKRDGASTTPQNGERKYASVPPPPTFKSADPRINHHHINNIGDPPKVNTVDFE